MNTRGWTEEDALLFFDFANKNGWRSYKVNILFVVTFLAVSWSFLVSLWETKSPRVQV